MLATHLAKIPDWLRPIIGWIGLTTVCLGALFITPDMAFPGPWAVVPVLGSAAIIAAGTGTESKSTLFPIINPVAGYIGEISYSLYLWHWPVIILMGSLLHGERCLYQVITVLIAVALSTLTFHLLEDPIRQSSWLLPRSQKKRRVQVPFATVGAAALVLAISVAGIGALDRAARPEIPALATDPPLTVETLPAGDPMAAASAGVESALLAANWPKLDPPIEGAGGSAPPELVEDCVNNWDTLRQHCVYGDPEATKTAMVIGDSTAISWLPSLKAALIPLGWKIDSYGKYGCPAASITVRDQNREPYLACDTHREWVFSQIEVVKPDMIIFGDVEGYIDALPHTPDAAQASIDWSAAMTKALNQASITNAPIYILSSPPAAPNIAECATKGSSPIDCVTDISDSWYRTVAAEKEAVESATNRQINVTYVDTRLAVCSQDGRCPGFANDIIIRSDINHFTAQYSTFLAPILRKEFNVF